MKVIFGYYMLLHLVGRDSSWKMLAVNSRCCYDYNQSTHGNFLKSGYPQSSSKSRITIFVLKPMVSVMPHVKNPPYMDSCGRWVAILPSIASAPVDDLCTIHMELAGGCSPFNLPNLYCWNSPTHPSIPIYTWTILKVNIWSRWTRSW